MNWALLVVDMVLVALVMVLLRTLLGIIFGRVRSCYAGLGQGYPGHGLECKQPFLALSGLGNGSGV